MEPRYAALARQIAQHISEGQHPVGSLLPGEVELAEQHGVSRATILMAMRQLQDMGLISRRKRAGTRVEASRPPAGYAQSLGTIEDLVQYAAEARREVRSIDEIVADDELAARLGCKPGQRWLRLITTRSDPKQSGRLISWTAAYLDPTYADAVREQVHQSTELISTIIGQAYGTYAVEIRQEIRAIGVPATIAPSLACDPGAPALEITRHYRQKSAKVEPWRLAALPDVRGRPAEGRSAGARSAPAGPHWPAGG